MVSNYKEKMMRSGKGAKTWVHERYFTPEELEAVVKLSGFGSVTLEILNDVMLLIAEKI